MATVLIRRMTQRSRNGAGSRRWHLVAEGGNHYRHALCGAQPKGASRPNGKPWGGAGWSMVGGAIVTCWKCIRAEKKAEAQKAA